MEFNVAHLLKEPVGTNKDYIVYSTLESPEETRGSVVQGKARLVRVNQGILVTASLRVSATCLCSRCLQDFHTLLELQLSEVYFPTVDINTGAALHVSEEVVPFFLLNDRHELDITEAVRQSVIVALPMKALCKEDCAGLCPYCGMNLNSGCICESKELDPRWAPLLELAPQSTSMK